MTVIAGIAMKCPNSKFLFDPKWFELELLSYLINLQWDECYSNNCDEMSKYEVSFWSNLVWDTASVISDKSLMRWLLSPELRWNVQIRSFYLIQNGLS